MSIIKILVYECNTTVDKYKTIVNFFIYKESLIYTLIFFHLLHLNLSKKINIL